jgi:maleamate amidohydrolase
VSTSSTDTAELSVYGRQGFGSNLPLKAPYGLLIIDFVNGFADPNVFGGGNIPAAIARMRQQHARRAGRWRTAASCFPTTTPTATSSA